MSKRTDKLNTIKELTGNRANLRDKAGYDLITLVTTTGTTTTQFIDDGIFRKPNERNYFIIDGLHFNHPDFPDEHKKAMDILLDYL